MNIHHKSIKVVVWHVIVTTLSIWMWGTGAHAEFSELTGLKINLPALGAFLLLTSCVVIGYMMFRSPRWTWPASISVIIAGTFLIKFGFTGVNLAGVVIFVGANYLAYARVGREMKERIKIHVFEILRRGLMPLILGIFVMVSFAAYQSPLAEDLQKNGSLPSQTVRIFQTITEQTLGNKIEASSKSEENKIIVEISNQAYQQANSLLKPYFQFAPPIVAFGLFVILWGLSWFFMFAGGIIGAIIFLFLEKLSVVRIEERDIKAEVLVV